MKLRNGSPSVGAKERLLSLDVFRGLTLAGMVLVNNAGDWQHIYPPLKHAEWHGWTPTDLVFPFFLLIVGIAIPIALENRRIAGESISDLQRQILRRTLIIFLIGLFLNWFPPTSDPVGRLMSVRIPGVLQRIAICYGISALLFLRASRGGIWRLSSALLVGYWLLLTFVPAPGFTAGDLSREGSLPSWVDRTLLPGHTYRPDYDPEGILSTVPALVTTLIGVLAGQWLRQDRDRMEKVAALFAAGFLLLLAGYATSAVFPINKALWTSSYVLFSGGLGLLGFALCHWLVDLRQVRAWSRPFVIFGVNALALFVLSGVMADLLNEIRLGLADGGAETLRVFLYRQLFLSWLSPLNASLAYAISYVLLWWVLMWVLYRKRIFIRI